MMQALAILLLAALAPAATNRWAWGEHFACDPQGGVTNYLLGYGETSDTVTNWRSVGPWLEIESLTNKAIARFPSNQAYWVSARAVDNEGRTSGPSPTIRVAPRTNTVLLLAASNLLTRSWTNPAGSKLITWRLRRTGGLVYLEQNTGGLAWQSLTQRTHTGALPKLTVTRKRL